MSLHSSTESMIETEGDSLGFISAPAAFTSQQIEGSLEDDPPNESIGCKAMQETNSLVSRVPHLESEGLSSPPALGDCSEDDTRNESNGYTIVKEGKLLVRPVPPGESGEGLPYAPKDFPNPGDTWSWKVGKRVAGSGYYCDRYLYLPKHLQKSSSGRVSFASKPSLSHFICSEFPDKDFDSFFASFSWKVPSTMHSWTEGDAEKKNEEAGKEPKKDEATGGIQKKRKQKSSKAAARSKRQTRQSVKESVKFCSEDTALGVDLSYDEGIETSNSMVKDLKVTNNESNEVFGDQDLPSQLTPEEFDDYLNSLDNILTQPLFETSLPPPATIISPAIEDEMAELRRKLNIYLAMDFPSLVSSEYVAELANLASKLKKDPSLSVDQLVKLNLIEEIPLINDIFLETKRTKEQADKFFADLEANKAEVTSLRSKYGELKEEKNHLQADVDSTSATIEDIDDQIARLQSQRADLVSNIETKNKRKDELASEQKVVAKSIHAVAQKIQFANSKMQEWAVKKNNSVEREAEILARFAPLKGFAV